MVVTAGWLWLLEAAAEHATVQDALHTLHACSRPEPCWGALLLAHHHSICYALALQVWATVCAQDISLRQNNK